MVDVTVLTALTTIEVPLPGESAVAAAARAAAAAAAAAAASAEAIDSGLEGRVVEEIAYQVVTQVDPKVALAEAARIAAELAADNAASAALLEGSFSTLADATAAIAILPEGHNYEVTDDGDNNGIWTKRSGVLVQTSTTTISGLDARTEILESRVKTVDWDGGGLLFTNEDGVISGGFSPSGVLFGDAALANLTADSATLGAMRVVSISDLAIDGIAVPFALSDGRVFGGIQTDGTMAGSTGGGSGSSSVISADEMNELSARGYAYAAQWRARPVSGYANFRADLFCHVVSDGQSLSNGTNGYPVNGNAVRSGIYMIGDSVHPTVAVSGAGAAEPYQWNGSAFVPGPVVLNAHAYTRAPNFRGHTPGESALDYLRRGFDERFGAGYATAKWVYSTGGVGGTSISQHLPGATEKYSEYWQAVVAYGKTAAAAEGMTYQLTAVPLLIGETDARSLEGGFNTRAWYKARVVEWYTGTVLPVCSGQALKPLVFAHQVSAGYNRNSGTDGGVALAQIELARDYPWFILWGGYAPYINDSTGHLTAAGYDTHGQLLGVAMEQALLYGVRMCPLQPVDRVVRGTEVVVSWTEDVEAGDVYDEAVLTTPPTGLGLDLFDDAGALAITALTIDRNLTQITTDRVVSGTLYVRNAAEAVEGATWIRGRSPLGVASMNYASSGVTGLDGTSLPTTAVALSFTLPATSF